MTTVAEALRGAARRLETVSDTARLDAELLMAHALGVSRSELLLRHMQDEAPPSFDTLIARRAEHEPVAYIIARKEFFGREFAVSPSSLIPRMDSETTVAAALEAAPAPHRVLDCGIGSGALLLTVLLEKPLAEGIGIDRSLGAVEDTYSNAARMGLVERIRLYCRDWTEQGWTEGLGEFDLIVANPPYVENDAPIEPEVRRWEPGGALFAGSDGLEAYRALLPQLPKLLTDQGVAVVEIGATQAEQVADIAAQSGFASEMRRDLGGRPRALVLRSALK